MGAANAVTNLVLDADTASIRTLPPVLLYPGGISETEILIAYGPTHFASKAGTLAGNHFLTIVAGQDTLAEFGRRTLWEGAQELRIEAL